MTLRDYLRSFFIKDEKAINGLTPSRVVVDDLGTTIIDGVRGHSEVNKREYLNEIKGWSYSCISAIADHLAFIELRLLKQEKNGDITEVEKHPLLDLLYKVNQYTTKFDHFWLTAAYLESVGEAPWFIDKDGSGTPVGIYLLDPTRVKPVLSKEYSEQSMITHFEFDLGMGKKIDIPFDQVVYLRYPDPNNPVRGLGTMQAVARQIDIEVASERWNLRFFLNNATPGAKLKVPTKNLTKEQRAKLKASIEQQYKGIDKSQQLWILFDDMDVEPFGLSQRDMDFSAMQEYSANKIRGIFRVPKTILAQSDEVNYANAKTAQEVFIKNTIMPKMERIIQQLNEFLVSQYAEEGIYLDYVNPLEVDRTLQLQVYENGLKNGWMTINEVRQEEGLVGIGNAGDQVYMPLNMVPIGAVEKPKKGSKSVTMTRDREYGFKMQNKKKVEEAAIRQQLTDSIKQIIKVRIAEGRHKHKVQVSKKQLKEKTAIDQENVSPIQLTAEQKQAFWQMKSALTDRYMGKVGEMMNVEFIRQEKLVKQRIRSQKTLKLDIDSVLLDLKAEAKQFLKDFTPIITLLIEEAGTETNNFIGIGGEFDASDPAVQKYMKSRIVKFSDATNETTNEAIKATIAEGTELNESLTEIAERVANVFSQARDYRSERIARTEVVRYSSEATELSFIESGVVEAKEWIVNPGACNFCLQFSGEKVALGELFIEKGDEVEAGNEVFKVSYEDVKHPPLHVNCNCDLVPVFSSQKIMSPERIELNRLRNRMTNERILADTSMNIKALTESIDKAVTAKVEQKGVEVKNDLIKKIEQAVGDEQEPTSKD